MNNLFATNNPTEHINDFNAGTYNGGQTTEVQQNDKVNYLFQFTENLRKFAFKKSHCCPLGGLCCGQELSGMDQE